MITKTVEIQRLQAELEKDAANPRPRVADRDEGPARDPKATYEAAAKAHDDLIRQFREAAARAAHLRTAIANIRESGVGNVLGMESGEDCLARTQPRLDAAEAEVRRLGAECDAADGAASRARAAMTGEPLPEPVVKVVAPAPAVVERRPATAIESGLVEHIQNLVPLGRAPAVAKAVMASRLVVSVDKHNKQVNEEIEAAGRYLARLEIAERRVAGLRDLIDHTAVGRLTSVVDVLDATPQQRTAKHGVGCWQRHAGCLAARIRDLLDGREVKA